jgi:hypothetical protein
MQCRRIKSKYEEIKRTRKGKNEGKELEKQIPNRN